jgi:hypothetical protein
MAYASQKVRVFFFVKNRISSISYLLPNDKIGRLIFLAILMILESSVVDEIFRTLAVERMSRPSLVNWIMRLFVEDL